MTDRFSQTLVRVLAVGFVLILLWGYFSPHLALVEAERQKVEQASRILRNAAAIAGRDTTSQIHAYLKQFVRP